MRLRQLLLHSFCIAIVFVTTIALVIPFPINGYFNLSDLTIMLAIFILDKYRYAISLSLGAVIADLMIMPIYAPMTFVIKWFLAISVLFLIRKTDNKFFVSILPYILGGLWVGISYAIVDSILFGYNIFFVSLMNNLIQGLCSSILTILSVPFIGQLKLYFKKFISR